MIYALVFFIMIQVITSLMIGWHGVIAFFGLIRPRMPRGPAAPRNRFAVLVCARNEEKVLPVLLKSLRAQDYPKSCWHVYLLADHCTDGTVEAAKKFPFVTAWQRNTGPETGKGAVLMWGIEKLLKERRDSFDAIMVFDADNVLKNDFMSRINEHLNKGNLLVQGNRISGEPYKSSITQWYACYWPTYTMYYVYPREKLHMSCVLTGTGFAVKKELLEKYGWHTHCITEDVEFSFQQYLHGHRTAFCVDARCYDEQPSTLPVMVRQLARWCTGNYEIFSRYFGEWRRAFKRKPCVPRLDSLILLTMGPATVFQAISMIAIQILWFLQFGTPNYPMLAFILLGYVFIVASAIVITRFYGIPTKKLMPGVLTFPFFLYIYKLCSAIAMVRPTKKWTPIAHEGLKDRQSGD